MSGLPGIKNPGSFCLAPKRFLNSPGGLRESSTSICSGACTIITFGKCCHMGCLGYPCGHKRLVKPCLDKCINGADAASVNLRIPSKQLCSLIFVFAATLVSPAFSSSLAVQAANEQVRLDQFQMMTESSCWVLLDQELFRTSDAGQTWIEISPSIPAEASVEDVQFIDS